MQSVCTPIVWSLCIKTESWVTLMNGYYFFWKKVYKFNMIFRLETQNWFHLASCRVKSLVKIFFWLYFIRIYWFDCLLIIVIFICRHGSLEKKLVMDLEEPERKLNIRLLRILSNIWRVRCSNFFIVTCFCNYFSCIVFLAIPSIKRACLLTDVLAWYWPTQWCIKLIHGPAIDKSSVWILLETNHFWASSLQLERVDFWKQMVNVLSHVACSLLLN